VRVSAGAAGTPYSGVGLQAMIPTEHRPIVVVDDDDDLRETLGELLSEEGYDARCFENGRVALDFLRALDGGGRPKLILLDLMMPEMNGWQFREEQLRDAALSGIPVVVMTASRSLAEHPIDVSEVLFKPIGLDQLLEAVERNAR
jgi:CheY-like chemotaxis protein